MGFVGRRGIPLPAELLAAVADLSPEQLLQMMQQGRVVEVAVPIRQGASPPAWAPLAPGGNPGKRSGRCARLPALPLPQACRGLAAQDA